MYESEDWHDAPDWGTEDEDDYVEPEPVDLVVDEAVLDAMDEIEVYEGEEETPETSWGRRDVSWILSHMPDDEPPPEVLERIDGPALLYRGKISSIAGQPEAGKGWFAILACAQEMLKKNNVVYVDFEDTPEGILRRFLQIGVPTWVLRRRLTLITPDIAFEPGGASSRSWWASFVGINPSLVILDGLTAALALQAMDGNDNSEVVKWFQLMPHRIIKNLSASRPAVLIVDHLPKQTEKDNRAALGAGQKLAQITGSQFIAVAVKTFSMKRAGTTKIEVTKDRPAQVRAVAGNELKNQVVTYMEVTPLPEKEVKGSLRVALLPPDAVKTEKTVAGLTISERMKQDFLKVLAEPQYHLDPLTRAGLYRTVKGTTNMKPTALRELMKDGFVVELKVDGRGNRLFLNPLLKATKLRKMLDAGNEEIEVSDD